MSHHIMRWKNVLLTKSKLQFYREYKYFFSVENYSKINLNRHQRSKIAKLRLGILPKLKLVVTVIPHVKKGIVHSAKVKQ